jgi:hypothetical protein
MGSDRDRYPGVFVCGSRNSLAIRSRVFDLSNLAAGR